jgi:hypothetical protein
MMLVPCKENGPGIRLQNIKLGEIFAPELADKVSNTRQKRRGVVRSISAKKNDAVGKLLRI